MLLEVSGIRTSYGLSEVLFDVSFDLQEGEAIALLGRNGMGKTTTVRSIVGMSRISSGEIRFAGERIDRIPPYQIPRRGIGLVPEGRRIFPNLNVLENLQMAFANRRAVADPWTCERVLELFPRLAEKLRNPGNRLSGGEQQMLAIARALVTNPTLLILDEATEGLAPLIRQEIWDRLAELRKSGLSMIIIDKDIDAISKLAHRHLIFERGEIVWRGTSDELRAATEIQAKYLSV
ncbi:ABC transporter ATP-binding protein [Pseudorhodoplanes sp.]|uniref:ABC transporter ATP-binding protein n=1 Tax=Pseudorhodoplanes sp. TaxID=1934341 RepID=UPI002CDA29A8|nr:ABC transporter ATP-binding protein [Pseudorhodoplanes sp.]HWV50946.1 ABC transporter ATP-binding protein [Pseudorhodoplanes sp.]